MRMPLKTLALSGLLFVPALVSAQAPSGPGAPRGQVGGVGVTHILNLRRQLDLTPRQVAQLDSMERVLWSEREKLRAQAEPQRDSLRTSLRQQMERGARPRQDSAARATMRREAEERMARIRPQMQALRQRDSTTRVAAERLLTDTQRTKLREMQAERRGFERGRREGMRGPNGRPQMRPGARGPQMQPGARRPRMQPGARPL